jgi:hypothetical protein
LKILDISLVVTGALFACRLLIIEQRAITIKRRTAMKYFISIILAVAILVPPLLSISGTSAQASTIPTFSIVSVVEDGSVTIRTSNFPANRTFTARMGAIGTRAIGGTVVGTLESGAGGALTATFNIPDGLKGSNQIAIRLDSTTGGYFAYNWFYNSTTAAPGTPVPTPAPGTPAPTPHVGIPTFSIQSVVGGESVTVLTKNFPANRTFTVRMDVRGNRAIGGTVVGTLESGSGGALTATFNIPATLKTTPQIAIRMDSTTGGFFAYNWFYNTTAPVSGTPAPTSIPGYSGIPTFSIQSVVRGDSVTILTKNFPPNQTFTARMAVRGNRAIGGTVVGTLDAGTGGALTATFNIPSSLASTPQIAIRLDSPAGYFAYNWFYNNTAP